MMESYFFGLLLVLSLFKSNLGDGLGYMQPHGRVYRPVNDTIETTCTLWDTSYFTINDLIFEFTEPSKKPENEQRLREIQNIKRISKTLQVNETTKMFVIENVPIIDDLTVNCVVKKPNDETATGIHYLKIFVGTPPQNVIDFKCRAFNRKDMKCTFLQPNNPVPINYKLSYRITSNKSELGRDLQNQQYVNTCSHFDRNDTAPYEQFCLLPAYRTYKYFVFELIGTNKLGENIEYFSIEPDNFVIPDQPTQLVYNQTSDSVKLSWVFPIELQSIERKIQYKIYYMCDFDNGNWKVTGPHTESEQHYKERKNANRATVAFRQMSHTITGLYAHTKYDVRVSIKVSSTPDTDEFWSSNSSQLFTTLSRKPDRPPHTDTGSFSVTNNNDIFIYWEELTKSEHNGDDFKYVVVDGNNKETTMSNLWWKLDNSSSFNLPKPLTFKIYSQNKEGRSNTSSIITIPNNRCPPPNNIKKFHEDKLYNISWARPKNLDEEITSYSVFWCEQNHSENENDCKGSIHFARVNSDITTYELTTTKTMNIALSTETRSSTSGMTWAKCTVGSGSELTFKSFTTSPTNTSTSIRCQWGTECVQQMMSTKYQLKYCPIGDDVRNRTCKDGEEKILNITDVHETEYTIKGLKPYTTYILSIRMVTDKIKGAWREAEFTTSEDAPTPPQELNYKNVTDTSVQLVWKQPEAPNGRLNGYTIYYNNQTISGINNTTYLLENLLPYTEYKVYVIAHTSQYKPSDPSNSIDFNTTIGKPGKMDAPKRDRGSITWVPPSRPGGHLDFYELLVTLDEKQRSFKTNRTVRVKRTVCTLKQPFLDPPIYGSMEFSVRAVNILPDAYGTMRRNKRDVSPESILTNGENHLIIRDSKTDMNAISKGMKTIEPKRLDHIANEEKNEETFQKFIYAFEHDSFCEEEQPQLGADVLLFGGKIFNGDFSSGHTFEYNLGSKDNSNYIIIVFMGIFIMVSFYGVYFSAKKFRHWGDIHPQLPPGLEDIKEVKTKHIDAGITRNEIVHTLEFLTSNDENDPLVNIKHPMESTSSSSSSSSNNSDNNSQSEYNEGMDNSIEYDQSTNPNGIQNINNDINNPNNKPTPTPLIPMQQTPMPMLPPIAQNTTNYMHNTEPHHLHDSQTYADKQINARPLPPTYPINNPTPLPLTSNGYVTHEAIIRKPPVTTGYTSLSSLKPANPIPVDEVKAKTSIITPSEIQGISGYVTQKQLSDFGQFQIH